MNNDDEHQLRDQILSIMYQFKQQGVDELRSSDLMMLLGYEEEEIPPEEFDIWLTLPEHAELEAEVAAAKIMGKIH
jgi:hypothetical protein